jgi:hypothetical protein
MLAPRVETWSRFRPVSLSLSMIGSMSLTVRCFCYFQTWEMSWQGRAMVSSPWVCNIKHYGFVIYGYLTDIEVSYSLFYCHSQNTLAWTNTLAYYRICNVLQYRPLVLCFCHGERKQIKASFKLVDLGSSDFNQELPSVFTTPHFLHYS